MKFWKKKDIIYQKMIINFANILLTKKRGKKTVFLLTKENKKMISPCFSISFIDKRNR